MDRAVCLCAVLLLSQLALIFVEVVSAFRLCGEAGKRVMRVSNALPLLSLASLWCPCCVLYVSP